MAPRRDSRSYSRSSQRRDLKRDKRSYQKQTDRYYGGDTRKRTHHDRQEREPYRGKYQGSRRDERRYQSPRRTRDERYDTSRGERDKYSRYSAQRQSRPRNTHPEKSGAHHEKQHVEGGIKVTMEEPDSDIKIHFRFRPIKVEKQIQSYLIQNLRDIIEKKIGKIFYFDKSPQSRPGYMILELGLLKDGNAMSYLLGNYGVISVFLGDQKVSLIAEPSKVFDLMMSQKNLVPNEILAPPSVPKNAVVQKKLKPKSPSSSRSHRSYSSESNRRKKSRRQDYQKDRNRDEKPSRPYQKKSSRYSPPSEKRYGKTQKRNTQVEPEKEKKDELTLLLFGLHSSVMTQEIRKYLYNHKNGSFYASSMRWKTVQDSNCQYLELKMPKNNAQLLESIGHQMQLKDYPFIIIDGSSLKKSQILQKIRKFQINILFPYPVYPYFVLKGMGICGTVVQLTSNNRLNENGESDYYNVTFNDYRVCQKLRQLKKTSDDILIQQIQSSKSILAYRPSRETELFST